MRGMSTYSESREKDFVATIIYRPKDSIVHINTDFVGAYEGQHEYADKLGLEGGDTIRKGWQSGSAERGHSAGFVWVPSTPEYKIKG